MAGVARSADLGPAQISEQARLDLLRVWPKISLRRLAIFTLVGLFFAWGIEGTQAAPGELLQGLPNIGRFIIRMFPPVFDTVPLPLATPVVDLGVVALPSIGFPGITVPFPGELIGSIVQTIQIAIVGTIFSIFLSIPFGLIAARNISPHPLIYQGTRFVLNANRAVPELIFALIFVSAVGLGPFGGVLAIAVGSVGFMAKVFAEAIEAIDPQQVQAIRATGATRPQTIAYAVVPQAFPLMLSYGLLLFESNVRHATILGLVGAGGIGFTLNKYMALFQFSRLTGALIFIVLMVTLVDRFSDFMRRRFI